MPRNRSRPEPLQFCSVKCKLTSVLLKGKSSPFLEGIRTQVSMAHELTKRCTMFFKAFCLWEGDVPPVNHSTMVACLNQVSTRSKRGAKGKATELAARMETFWKERFSLVFPEKVNAVGRSRVRAAVAEQVTDCVLTNSTTNFESRCRRLCSLLGVDRKKVHPWLRRKRLRRQVGPRGREGQRAPEEVHPVGSCRAVRHEEEAIHVCSSHLQAVH